MFLLRHACILSCSVVSNSLKPFGLQPSKHFCPWNFPGKNTGVGCHFLHLRFHFIELTSAFPLPELFGACYTLQSRSSKLIPIFSNVFTLGLPRQLSGKESTCQCRRHRRCGFHLWVRKILWKRKWQLTPVFLPVRSHGQRSLSGYSPWGRKESDRTEQAHTCMLEYLRVQCHDVGMMYSMVHATPRTAAHQASPPPKSLTVCSNSCPLSQ